ncbi:MAG: RNA polymerase sigma factor [Planctomycetota bacterium]|jgi:RNA polymerase sigma-70 factor (ECF subfamily)
MRGAPPDGALVAAVRDGDAGAFDALVERHLGRVRSVALAVVQDAVAADDVTQQAFLRAWRKLDTLADPERFGPWCRTIARNAGRNWLRDHAARAPRPLAGAPEPADPSRSGADQLADREAVQRAVAALAAPLREAIRLRYVAELSYREIAELLNEPLSTVRDRLYRARRELKEILES